MSLLRLPNELLLCISEKLEFHQEINAFARSSRHLYNLLNNYLYMSNVQKDGGSALFYAARHKQPEVVRKLLEQVTDESPRVRSNLEAALQISAEIGENAIVELLLDNGIAFHAEN